MGGPMRITYETTLPKAPVPPRETDQERALRYVTQDLQMVVHDSGDVQWTDIRSETWKKMAQTVIATLEDMDNE
tara:strand:+ start:528 stop:749 length:222 start_codon:yes stop_codon:yes gene_type:complete